MVSARHLLNLTDWPDLLMPGNDDKMIWLHGKMATTFKQPTGDRKIDFAVLQLAPRQVKHIVNGHYAFIKPEHMIVNHALKQDNNYIIAGYPVTGVRKKYGRSVFTPIPLKLVSYPVSTTLYEKNGFHPEHHILIRYQRKLKSFYAINQRLTSEATGISGSGLWFVPDWNKKVRGIPEFFLAGILIENYKQQGFLAALRIDFIVDVIRRYFDKPHLMGTVVNTQAVIDPIYFGERS